MEKCPLAGGGQTIGEFPETCTRKCQQYWEFAHATQTGDWDDYQKGASELDSDARCDHTSHDVVFSHEGIQAVDDSPLRYYSIVDKCDGCEAELGETTYEFICPNN